MADVTFNAGLDVVSEGQGSAIPGSHLIAVEVLDVRVDTATFVSHDLTRRREGIVQLDVCGQQTVFTFAGAGALELPVGTKLACFAACPGSLSLQVRVVEDDQGEWGSLEHLQTFLGVAAGLPASLLNPVAGAGLGLASAFVGFLRSHIRNHDETIGFAVLDDPLRDGQTVTLRFPRGDQSRVTVRLRVVDLGVKGKSEVVAVRACTPRLTFSDLRIVERDRAPGPVGRSDTVERTYDVARWLDERRRLRRFAFVAASGTRRFSVATDLGPLSRVLGWDRAELFHVAGQRAGDWFYMPFSSSVSLNSESLDAASVAALLGSTAELAEALDTDAKGTATWVRKQGQSLIELVNELSASELSLFTMDGLLAVPAVAGAVPVEARGIQILHADPSDAARASAELSCELRKWQPQPLGTFAFGVETRRG